MGAGCPQEQLPPFLLRLHAHALSCGGTVTMKINERQPHTVSSVNLGNNTGQVISHLHKAEKEARGQKR